MAFGFIAIAALQLWQAHEQSERIDDVAEETARANEANADLIEIDAHAAEQDGFTQSSRYQSTIDTTVGSQRVAFASQDVDVSSGTAKAIQEETRLIGFLNQQAIQTVARNKASGLRMQARNVRIGASLTRAQGDVNSASAFESGLLRGLTTVTLGSSENSSGSQRKLLTDKEA